MNSSEIRERYLQFFKDRGHAVIPSSSLVPENDPTTLFVGSGMQPLIPYLLGQPHPMGTRLVNSQKSFRAEDIEEVGDNRHTTFFEMLGNWSLGDYFKEEQLPWLFEFLTDELKLDPKRLYVTVFSGDEEHGIPKDEESIAIWKRLFQERGIEAKAIELGTEQEGYDRGMQGGRIFAYNAKKNWWSRAGMPENMPPGEPGGPDSEVFFEFENVEHDLAFGENCHPNCDCGRFLEIGNSVFMEYQKKEDGSFARLKQRNVDFGGGLERITAAVNNNPDIFRIDTLYAILKEIKTRYAWDYDAVSEYEQSIMRIVADHVRAATFMIGDDVRPSNTEQGYMLRRLLRRAVLNAYNFAKGFSNLYPLVDVTVGSYTKSYPELRTQSQKIHEVFEQEEERFMATLRNGVKLINDLVKRQELQLFEEGEIVPKFPQVREIAQILFELYTVHGFPVELSLEEIDRRRAERGQKPTTRSYRKSLLTAFEEKMREHKILSRTATAGRFKGGLADTSYETTKLHTANHLLLAALRKVLGEHVHQRGSNITVERIRLDFSHSQKLTPEELQQVEDLVNQKIQEGLTMVKREMSKEEAVKLGAEMEFGVKYGDVVSVYFAEDNEGDAFSKEFCGGPHVQNTSELSHFKITKEEAVSAGVRRLRAVLEPKKPG